MHLTKDLVNLVRNLDLTEGDGRPWKVHDLSDLSFEKVILAAIKRVVEGRGKVEAERSGGCCKYFRC